MAGIIQLLPESTANQIAAGEVVQRPASVVKELLENAVDAGSTLIKLYIKNGGCTHIQVDDNGCGMNAFDARMCWERHATSKITKADDLYNLSTLGFRGEALASIASVSEVEMKTKSADESVGTRIVINAGVVETQENTATTQGTSFTIKNLFYNIPARKNFLKSISVETKHIFEEYQRIALAYPAIGFEFYNQDKNLSKLRGGSLKHRIADLFRVKEDELIDASEQTEIVGITGYVGSPKLAKRTRGNQYLFANGRFIKDAYLNHAISSAYGGLLEDKTYPFFVVFLDVEPSKIDVNIHPTKHEVKFEDGRHVYTLLQSVIKKTLGVHFVMPTPTQLNNALSNGQSQNYNPTLKTTNPDIRFNPFDAPKQRTSTEWEKLDELLNTPVNQVQQQQIFENSPTPPTERTTNVTDVFQVEGAFIITHLDGELCLVNQHRAHAQVLYERYEANQHVSSQQLLFPRTVELSKADLTLYLEMKDEINALGFDTSEFGKDAIIINGLPSELSKADGADVIVKILDDFKTNYQDIKLDKRDALKQAAAKNAAIKAGKVLGKEEMIQLLSDLLHCKQYTTNQAGKAIIVKLTNSSLERFFQ
ncbi:MAG: DNA mismatch repair endonuclease MutL [Bacteroidetes bacterium]|jgi:DNA mismatch repair protein MutL|nr:DNA mismatch repair endonuclease MutL [Bacteroidota bacterium]